MRQLFIPLFVVFLLVVASCEKEKTYKSYPPVPAMESAVLDEINEYRESVNLPALELDSMITEFAREHSNNMASGKLELGHDGFDSRADNIIQQLGNGAVAENVAGGNTPFEDIIQGWLDSPGHKANIEGDYIKTGIGVMKNDDGIYYYTQIFWGERK